jgi:hypothetical protein
MTKAPVPDDEDDSTPLIFFFSPYKCFLSATMTGMTMMTASSVNDNDYGTGKTKNWNIVSALPPLSSL